MYFIGIDGGGTKSRLRASFEEGRKTAVYTGNGTNLYVLSKEKVKENLRLLFERFFQAEKASVQECGGICVGSAGIDAEKNRREMEQIMKELGFCCPLRVMNDTLLYLLAEKGKEPRMILVAGTGSNSYGISQDGTVVHTGGWDYLLGDEGSGYSIGLEGLRAVMRAFDGRGEKTSLTEKLLHDLGKTEVPQLMDFAYCETTKKMDIARLSALVLEEAKKGDSVCTEIEQRALESLLEHVKALYSGMGLNHEKQFKVLIQGGLFENNFMLAERLKEKIKAFYPKAVVQRSERDGALCALSIAEKKVRGGFHEKL